MNNDWIEWHWTPEKPYPESLETEVFVRFSDGAETHRVPWSVGWFYGDGISSNWHQADDDSLITHYKLA